MAKATKSKTPPEANGDAEQPQQAAIGPTYPEFGYRFDNAAIVDLLSGKTSAGLAAWRIPWHAAMFEHFPVADSHELEVKTRELRMHFDLVIYFCDAVLKIDPTPLTRYFDFVTGEKRRAFDYQNWFNKPETREAFERGERPIEWISHLDRQRQKIERFGELNTELIYIVQRIGALCGVAFPGGDDPDFPSLPTAYLLKLSKNGAAGQSAGSGYKLLAAERFIRDKHAGKHVKREGIAKELRKNGIGLSTEDLGKLLQRLGEQNLIRYSARAKRRPQV